MGFNVAALAISIVALVASALLAFGQLRSTQRANTLAMFFDGFRETRSPEFRRSIEYVLYHLREEFPTPVSYLELPEGPKEHVRQVAFFYDELGKLVVHGIVDRTWSSAPTVCPSTGPGLPSLRTSIGNASFVRGPCCRTSSTWLP